MDCYNKLSATPPNLNFEHIEAYSWLNVIMGNLNVLVELQILERSTVMGEVKSCIAKINVCGH